MFEFLSNLFDTSDFPARWDCGVWTSGHGWLHVLSDLGVWSAYLAIPCVLGYFIFRRKNLPFRRVFLLFGAFILACGSTHLMEAIIFWWPAYRLAGVIKLFTALVSWATVFALIQIVPKALAMRSPEELKREVNQRQQAENALQQSHVEQEQQVQEWTEELGIANEALQVADRRRAELLESLQDSELRFRTMADSIPQLAWMARPDGYIYWYNKRWHDYTGMTHEVMKGWGWEKVHDPEILPSVMTQWKMSITNGELFDMVFPLKGADGQFRPFLTRVMPVRDEDGQVVHWFGTNTDIADRLQIEAALRAAKEEAEEANRAKTQFLAVLSHELRTPLNPILLATSAMLERPTDTTELRPTLEMIRQNVHLQARLIDDLLDVMRIVRGKMPLHWEVADCHRLIEQAVQICQSEVNGHSLRLEMELSATSRYVNADAARLQQVFWNLIKNAVKFTPAGGLITIRTHNETDPDQPNGRIVIEVSDTGIGIEPDVLPKIFDPFQQGESTITRRFGGLGLGLAICKGVVEAHGGEISSESGGQDKGATFRVIFNALAEQELQSNSDPAQDLLAVERGKLSSLRILVVEDEPTTMQLMARLLRGLGHEVTTANSVASALDSIQENGLDMIISDIGLPDGSGLDLLRQAIAIIGPIPAIALTGYGMEEDLRKSREAGFTAHVTKPIDFAKLEAMIQHAAYNRS